MDNPMIKRFVELSGLCLAHSVIDLDPRVAENSVSSSSMLGIGIGCAHDNAGNAFAEDGLGARGSSAESRAGLKRNVKRGAAEPMAMVPGILDRFHFRVGFTCFPVPPPAYDSPALHQQGSDHRIGGGLAPSLPGQAQGDRHKSGIPHSGG
jgi:hypothetical protein